MRLSLYKVTELDLLWCQIRALCIMTIKLTGNSFANETVEWTKHLLSQMSPKVFLKKYIVHLSLSLCYNAVCHSLERPHFQSHFFQQTSLDFTSSHCRYCLIKSLSFFPSPHVSGTRQIKVSLYPFSFCSQPNQLFLFFSSAFTSLLNW